MYFNDSQDSCHSMAYCPLLFSIKQAFLNTGIHNSFLMHIHFNSCSNKFQMEKETSLRQCRKKPKQNKKTLGFFISVSVDQKSLHKQHTRDAAEIILPYMTRQHEQGYCGSQWIQVNHILFSGCNPPSYISDRTGVDLHSVDFQFSVKMWDCFFFPMQHIKSKEHWNIDFFVYTYMQ